MIRFASIAIAITVIFGVLVTWFSGQSHKLTSQLANTRSTNDYISQTLVRVSDIKQQLATITPADLARITNALPSSQNLDGFSQSVATAAQASGVTYSLKQGQPIPSDQANVSFTMTVNGPSVAAISHFLSLIEHQSYTITVGQVQISSPTGVSGATQANVAFELYVTQ